jgi:hypothetical protein
VETINPLPLFGALRYADRQYGNFQEVSLKPSSGPKI